MSSFAVCGCATERDNKSIRNVIVSIHAEKSQCDIFGFTTCMCVAETKRQTNVERHTWLPYCTNEKTYAHSTKRTTDKNNVANITLWTTLKKRNKICGVRNGFGAPFHLHGLGLRLLLWWYFDVEYVLFSLVFGKNFDQNVFCYIFLWFRVSMKFFFLIWMIFLIFNDFFLFERSF